jgi:hypothetical protein
MNAMTFVIAGGTLVVILAGIAWYRLSRRVPVAVVPIVPAADVPQRSAELEARIRTMLAGPRTKYGEIFTDYSVWRSAHETRLELVAGAPWKKLNEFTRSLIVRYLWRVLESLAGGAVVVVDEPHQVWNEDVDSGFRDQGFDWKTFGLGPQFVNE